MRGSRPLTKEEVQETKRLLKITGRCRERNYALFVIDINTGFRIGELLSLRVNDLLNRDGSVTDYLTVKAEYMKGNCDGRTVYLNTQGKKAAADYIAWLRKQGFWYENRWLFYSERFKPRKIDISMP